MPDTVVTAETASETEVTASETEQSTDVDYKAELEKARKALADVNRESAKRRKQLEAYEAEEAKRKAESMTELEKAQAALAEAQTKAEKAELGRRGALVRAAVIASASTRKFADTEDALRFIDQAKVTVDENDVVTGIDEQLDVIAKNKPYLLQTEQQQGSLGATNPGRGNVASESDAQRRARLFGGGGGNPFAGPGGGVILPQ